jgi:hypothetical protein
MRLTTITVAAAVGLALLAGATGCDREPTGTANEAHASPSHTGIGHTPDSGETPGHHDAYKEAAEKFALPRQRIIDATIAARLTMLERGGPTGDRLTGTDPAPEPLNQGGHLDPAVLSVFTTHLQVPADRARTVMEFLLGEWNEYDKDAETTNLGTYDRIATYVAQQLKISKEQARWIETLLISRPVGGDKTNLNDPIFPAVAARLGITAERLAEVVDGAKTQPGR